MRLLSPLQACLIAATLVIGPVAAAQTTFDNLQIEIEGTQTSTDGGERESVGWSTGGIEIGRARPGAFEIGPSLCFGVSHRASIDASAIAGWVTEVTATGVRRVDNAVTFRLQWNRARSPRSDPGHESGDVELTLRPGQSWLVDTIAAASVPVGPMRSCSAAPLKGLRVAVNYHPSPYQEHRVVETDMWLIERGSDGRERSWPLKLRGLFNQAVPFFFDVLSDGGVTLDFFGELRLVADAGRFRAELDARSRVTSAERSSTTLLPMGNGFYAARKVEQSVSLSPADVVDVELPRLGENADGAFAGRSYSIRLRARQLR